ncbi:MAG: flagellar basal-body rod protein FlgF [bacterium]
MIKGIYTVAASMSPRMRQQEVIADNIANVQTAGFKGNSVFMRMVQSAQSGSDETAANWETQMLDRVYTDFSQGSLEHTGRDLDLALEGDGFFVIETALGEAYTRNGSFSISPAGLLVTSNGDPVQTDAGTLAITGNSVRIDPGGQITVDDQPVAVLRVVDFPQPYELERQGATVWRAPGDAVAEDVSTPMVRQGYLEKSNIDVLREMVDMIDSFRAFENSQRLIQIQDESLSKAVNEVGKL